ncbi:MAG: AAA family ATPase, partial [Deltaproteobacteria bacterium]|nr:AAA family ATPase [Deltaproteobacteria bacterium]
PQDPELDRIVAEEQRCLDRTIAHLTEARARPRREATDYDAQLLALRDEIAAARMEDVPPLLEQMERLQGIAARQRELVEGTVDPRSPYFARMVLREGGKTREVLVGRSTYVDSRAGVRIVDWRDAPVSRIFYRYAEGDEYEETFGEREVLGEVVVRRSLTIVDGVLRRIICPAGMFVRTPAGEFKRAGAGARLEGGQGEALRPDHHHRTGKLGLGSDLEQSEDRHLREITSLIDPRQFELITAASSGLVVIQGGAGSGKTTIGLHRLAYLAFQDRRRFRPDRMLVVVFNEALARYVGQVLPALDVPGVPVRTYHRWANKLRLAHVAELPDHYTDDTPPAVTRLKKHPAMLHAVDRYVGVLAERIETKLQAAVDRNYPEEIRTAVLAAFRKRPTDPLSHRLHAVLGWLGTPEAAAVPTFARHAIERVCNSEIRDARDTVTAFAELLTDRGLIEATFAEHAPGELSAAELARAFEWILHRATLAVAEVEHRREQASLAEDADEESGKKGRAGGKRSRPKSLEEAEAEPKERDDAEAEQTHTHGVDGIALEDVIALDREDDTLLLRLVQRLRGPLLRPGTKEALVYEHVLIDEAQDLSPVELAVLLGTVSRSQSVTLCGDVAQRLHMLNGFTTWKGVLGELGLSHVEVEPLRIAYRSTAPIIDFARVVLGSLADPDAPRATRTGAPVEIFRFSHGGDAVGFLAEALRDLVADEPLASIAVIARFPEQADAYAAGLKKAEVQGVRRIARQDFPFKPGIDVTDIRQVKGLEFDYVVLVEVTEGSYPDDDEARHLLHIGATRAAHQLWLLAADRPSRLLPPELRDREY